MIDMILRACGFIFLLIVIGVPWTIGATTIAVVIEQKSKAWKENEVDGKQDNGI